VGAAVCAVVAAVAALVLLRGTAVRSGPDVAAGRGSARLPS
jgi:hypothetical protein